MGFLAKRKLKKADGKVNEARQLLQQGEFQKAKKLFSESAKLFEDSQQRKAALICKGYVYICDGMMEYQKKNFLEAAKFFGKANVEFSGALASLNELEKNSRSPAKKAVLEARKRQAECLLIVAREKGTQSGTDDQTSLYEAARFYESAATILESLPTDEAKKQAIDARAHALLQRAAIAKDMAEKSRLLSEAAEKFKIIGKANPLIEAHARRAEGEALIHSKPKDALQSFKQAYDLYLKAGREDLAQKITKKLEEIKERIEEYR